MKNIPTDIYKKIEFLSNEVKQNLKKKGIIIPSKNDDGSVNIGFYKIVKTDYGYSILDKFGEAVIERINLPQSAVVLANDLALGRFKNDNILNHDRYYGYAAFEEELHSKIASKKSNKSRDTYEIVSTKASIARAKKETHRRTLLSSYQKLIKLV
jgi:hypothetical protein